MPLQHYLRSPAKAATKQGMAALRIFQILIGFSATESVVAGMDEVLRPLRRGVADIAWMLDASSLEQLFLPSKPGDGIQLHE